MSGKYDMISNTKGSGKIDKGQSSLFDHLDIYLSEEEKREMGKKI